MLVLIDESGCPGFKLGKGSARYFVIAMVIFNDLTEAELVSAKIAELRKTFKVNPEFKFSKTCAELKDKFFESICHYNFKVRALVIDKPAIYSSVLREDTDFFYNFCVKSLLKYDNGILVNASIKIDGSGDKGFKKALNAYLRKYIGTAKITKFKFVDSKRDNLIQLADMIVGAIARSYNENRNNKDRWLGLLKKHNRISDIWDFK